MCEDCEFVKCSKCDGVGKVKMLSPSIFDREYHYYRTCDKCDGFGKLDWIDNILGKHTPKIRKLKAKWTMELENDIPALYDLDVEKEVVRQVSLKFAKKMDEEILGSILNPLEHNNKNTFEGDE